jgi:hypothetical protein
MHCPETGTEKGINYFNKFYGKSTKPWFEALRRRRQVMVAINRLRSSHTSLKQSLQNREKGHQQFVIVGKEQRQRNISSGSVPD